MQRRELTKWLDGKGDLRIIRIVNKITILFAN